MTPSHWPYWNSGKKGSFSSIFVKEWNKRLIVAYTDKTWIHIYYTVSKWCQIGIILGIYIVNSSAGQWLILTHAWGQWDSFQSLVCFMTQNPSHQTTIMKWTVESSPNGWKICWYQGCQLEVSFLAVHHTTTSKIIKAPPNSSKFEINYDMGMMKAVLLLSLVKEPEFMYSAD